MSIHLHFCNAFCGYFFQHNYLILPNKYAWIFHVAPSSHIITPAMKAYYVCTCLIYACNGDDDDDDDPVVSTIHVA